MPTFDRETERGTLLEWAVDEGGSVAEGDRLAAVASERRVAAVEAGEDGVLRRTYLAVDDAAPPGTPIGIVAPADCDITALEAEAAADIGFESRIERGLTDGGERAGMPGRAVTAVTSSGRRGRIEAGPFEWSFDEPESNGGTETGPTPVDVFLGGLASCLSLSTRYQANKRDASVDAIRVDANARPEHGPVERIAATIRLATDEDDETVARIVDLAERGCHVSQLLRADLPLDLSWERR
nr:OsmC family protein [Natrinema salaciae]